MSVDDEPGAPSTNFTLADIYVEPESIAGIDEDNALAVITSIAELAQTAESALGSVIPADGTWITSAAAAPTTFVTPLYYDSTAISGGLYAWNGSAYIQIGGLIA